MDEKPINWDKLWEHLDSQEKPSKGLEDLTDEEVEMLRYAEEVRHQLQGTDAEAQFPVQEGWRALSRKKFRKAGYRMLPYAAVLLLAIGAGLWLYNRNVGPTDALSEESRTVRTEKFIKLVLANGEELALTDQSQDLLDAGSRIEAGSDRITYGEEELEGDPQGAELKMNRLVVPFGKRTSVLLSDSTQIWVNAGTVLEYPVRFAGDKREVYVKGEAYFEVKPSDFKSFSVHVGDLEIRVLGTSFGVNTFDETVETALVEGSVALKTDGTTRRLVPGEVGSYDPKTSAITTTVNDIRHWVAWKDEVLYFNNMPLRAIADRLSRTYDYQFRFEDATLGDLRFTIDVHQVDDLTTVLNYLALSVEVIDFEISGNEVRVRRKTN